MTNIPLSIDYKGQKLKGIASALEETVMDGKATAFAITLNEQYMGVIHRHPSWKMDSEHDPELVELIGKELDDFMENQ